ncbi:MAG: DUF4340 domain-containing protein [Saprospiraceae bacterium]|nr:DUF4340 domain-containing protein [Saprospiraceae bacterium]
MRNPTFIMVLLLGIACYALYTYWPATRQLPQSVALVAVDTNKITSVSIHQPQHEYLLTRSESGWIASDETFNIRVPFGKLNAVLQHLHHISTQKIAAKKQEDWPRFAVDPAQAIQVEVFEGERLSANFMLGSISQDSLGKSISFLRQYNDPEVYVIDAAATQPFRHHFNDYRNKHFLKIKDWQSIDTLLLINEVDTFRLSIADLSSHPDSASLDQYFQQIAQIQADTFADDFDELQAFQLPQKTLYLKGETIKGIEIQCFVDTLAAHRSFVLHSSQLPQSYFSSDSTTLFYTIFGQLEALLSSQ